MCSNMGSGGGGGSASTPNVEAKVNKIDGVNGTVFTSYQDIMSKSKNTIWAEDTARPHGIFENERGNVSVSGDKKDRFALIDSVNTAIVHVKHISPNGYTKRDVTKLNSTIKTIKNMGYDTPLAYTDNTETLIYVKRHRFTKEF